MACSTIFPALAVPTAFAVHLGAFLAAALEAPLAPRPAGFHRFPSVDGFRDAGGRRLAAEEDGRPQRTRYEVEEQGHRFEYEFSGDDRGVRVIDVNEEPAVVALGCSEAEDGDVLVRLQWRSGSVPGKDQDAPAPLGVGDVLTGGAEWGCGPANFLVEVAELLGERPEGPDGAPATVVRARLTTPFHVVQDMYLDFSWSMPASREPQEPLLPEAANAEMPPQRTGRGLADDHWGFKNATYEVNYNYNPSTGKATEEIDIDTLKCFNCFARLGANLSLRIVTDTIYPKEVTLRIGANLHVHMEVGVSPTPELKAVLKMWLDVLNFTGPDLLTTAAGIIMAAGAPTGIAAAIPIFTAVNAATLQLTVKPVAALQAHLRSIVEMVMDGRLVLDASTSSEDTYFEVTWEPQGGLTTSSNFNLQKSIELTGAQLPDSLAAGLRTCYGLNVLAGNSLEPLTFLNMCPELIANATSYAVATVPEVPRVLMKTVAGADVNLCFEFLSFSTDADGDLADVDEPYVKGCFLGRCVQTSTGPKFGKYTTMGECPCKTVCGKGTESYAWCYVKNDCSIGQKSTLGALTGPWARCGYNKVFFKSQGVKCLDIKRSDLDTSKISLQALDSDKGFGYDDQYAEGHSFLLGNLPDPAACRTAEGCEVTRTMVPLMKGSYAEMVLKISVTDTSRRLEEDTTCQGTAVTVNLGVSSTFGGVKFPSFFSKGQGQEVVASADGPSEFAKDPSVDCKPTPGQARQSVDANGGARPSALLAGAAIVAATLLAASAAASA